MKIRMRTTSAGPKGVILAGQIVDMPDDIAEELVRGGYGEKLNVLDRARVAIQTTDSDVALRELREEARAEVQEADIKIVDEVTAEDFEEVDEVEAKDDAKKPRGRPRKYFGN